MHRLCADAGCWSGSGGSSRCCPIIGSHPTGLQRTLLRHQHHDSQVQNRHLSRPRTQPAGLRATETYAHAHTRKHARGDEYCSDQPPRNRQEHADRGELHRAADFALFRCRNASRTDTRKRKITPRESFHATKHVIVGQGRQQRALRQLCGTVPPGEDAGQRTDRLVKAPSEAPPDA